MKRLFTILLVAAFSFHAAADKPWKLGVEGGVSLSKVSAKSEVLSSDNRVGWFVGPKIKFKVPVLGFGCDAAVLYRYNDVKYLSTDNNYYKNTAHMLAAPVNLRYDFSLGKVLGIYIATGPQFNWTMKEKVSDANVKDMIDLRDYYFDWNAGAGIELFKHLQIGVNYNFPLKDMGKVNNVKLKGQTWNARVAYIF